MITFIIVVILAGFGALTPIVAARTRAAPAVAKIAMTLILALPVIAVCFLPPLASQLGHIGRILALGAFGVTFSIVSSIITITSSSTVSPKTQKK